MITFLFSYIFPPGISNCLSPLFYQFCLCVLVITTLFKCSNKISQMAISEFFRWLNRIPFFSSLWLSLEDLCSAALFPHALVCSTCFSRSPASFSDWDSIALLLRILCLLKCSHSWLTPLFYRSISHSGFLRGGSKDINFKNMYSWRWTYFLLIYFW